MRFNGSMSSVKCDNKNNSLTDNRLFNYAAGGVAGWGTYRATRAAIVRPYGRYYTDVMKKIITDEHISIADAAKDVFQTSKLRVNGFQIKELTKDTADTFINETVSRAYPKMKPRKNLLYYILGPNKADKLRNSLKSVAEGNNACYIPWMKAVAVNRDKKGFAVFHELGHAMNHTGKGLGKSLHRIRNYGSLALPFVLAYGLLTNKKENPRYADEKVHNFVKEHCGALMFACMIPTLMEEGLASINGAKIAKPKLSKDLYNKMCKGYTRAWGTYAMSAIAIGLCGSLAVYVRDKVVGNKKS